MREVDLRTIGDGGRGPVTARLQEAFSAAVHGHDPRFAAWLDVVGSEREPQPAPAPAAPVTAAG